MKAIILAAGRGSRMKNLTDELPKCLVKLRGKSLLDWQLDALRGAGNSEISIITGYMRELLSNRGLIEFHNPRWADTQMVTSLTYASEWLQDEPLDDAETFRMSNSQTLLEIGQKPKSIEEIEGQYMGLLRFEPNG